MKRSDTLDVDRLREVLKEVDASLILAREGEPSSKALVAALEQAGAKDVACDDDPLWEKLGLISALREHETIRLLEPPGENRMAGEFTEWRAQVAEMDVGLTSAMGLAAETGTLLLSPNEIRRVVSLLPVMHIAVLRGAQVVEDIEALFRLWKQVGLVQGNAVFVTGPSRTADIEKELVLGVHGPQALSVLLMM